MISDFKHNKHFGTTSAIKHKCPYDTKFTMEDISDMKQKSFLLLCLKSEITVLVELLQELLELLSS